VGEEQESFVDPLPEVVIEAPETTDFINALVNQLNSMGYDASASAVAKEDLPTEGEMFFQFTDPTPNAAQILSQVEQVAKKYCWSGTANWGQMNEASAAIMISYPQSMPAKCPGAAL